MQIVNYPSAQEEIVKLAHDVIVEGGLVVAPTDTVYGLLADANNIKAVEKLIKFKSRPQGKPISVFVADLAMINDIVLVGKSQMSIIQRLLPGPYTVVLPSMHKVCPLLESETGTLGVRWVRHVLIQSIVQQLNRPITATSANLSGKSPNLSIASLLSTLSQNKRDLIDLVIDGGTLPRRQPSTVIDLTLSQPKILRQGDQIFTQQSGFLSRSLQDTYTFARKLLDQIVNSPTVILLQGELGAGKTALCQALGRYLGTDAPVISPTYVTMYEYNLSQSAYFRKLYHFDFYNLESEEEVEYVGLKEALQQGNLICIEWPERISNFLPIIKQSASTIWVEIFHEGENTRTFKLYQS